MPIYEYRCERCEERFEQLVYLRSDQPPVTCPLCGAQEVRKQISAFVTTVKGQATNQSNCAPSGG